MLISIGKNILDLVLVLHIDRHVSFSFPGIGLGKSVIIFGVDMSSSVHIDNKKKYILISGKGPTQISENTLTAEKMYSINFTEHNKKFCLSLQKRTVIYLLMINRLINLRRTILKL